MKILKTLFSKTKNYDVHFCVKNIDQFFSEEELARYSSALLSKKNVHFQEYHCQNKCEECRVNPYALVNGKFIKADNPDDLLKKLLQKVEG